jgi:hypothetical protein
MLVWGGSDLRNFARGDGAAYDPATDSWRVLPPPPFEPSGRQVAVWARARLIVVDGNVEAGGPVELDMASYTPATDSWERLPSMELTRAGGYSVAFAGQSVLVFVTAFDPAAETFSSSGYELDLGAVEPPPRWTAGPAAPAVERVGGAELFTGTEVLVPAALPTGGDAVAAFDVASETWRIATPPLGLGGGGNTWTGTLAVFGLGTGGMDRRTIYDPTRDAWFGIPDAAGIHRESATQVWAGDRLLLWGGFEGESFLRPPGGLAFVPTALYGIAAQASDVAIDGVRVEAVDASRTLTGVRTPTPAEMDAIDTSQLGADGINAMAVPFGDRSVFVYWIGGPGDLAARIEIGADGRSIDLVAVPTHGDAMPLGQGVILTFDREIRAGEIDLSFWDGTR